MLEKITARKKIDQKLEVVVKNHGNKKEQEEQEQVQQGALFGGAVV